MSNCVVAEGGCPSFEPPQDGRRAPPRYARLRPLPGSPIGNLPAEMKGLR
jgi:hypothetical protein